MSNIESIFSESWHRIAGLRLALRPALQIRKQFFRGEKWYTLQDAFDSQFFRFRPAAHQFLARLTPQRTVQEVWEECVAAAPQDAPTQPEVLRLLTQLYQANLLHTELPPDSARLLQRRDTREKRQIQSTLLNALFIKIPLCDPDAFLKRCVAALGWLARPWAVWLWVVVLFSGLKIAADHWPDLQSQGKSALAPDNLVLLSLSFLLTKAVHEFGHGFLCRAFGGEVHRLGVMLMIFNPMPYVDATASWAFRSRRQRILVSAGGMIFELFFASIAAWIWAMTAPGTLHRLAGNIMFVASVSTLLFNLNPLVRFDGYYILSDLLDVPNLAARAQEEMRGAFERWICGTRRPATTESKGELALLVSYGIGSAVNRILLTTGIVLYVGERFFEIGLLLAIGMLISGLLLPVWKFFVYLISSPALARCRPRALGLSGAFAAMVIGTAGFLPWPSTFRAAGVIEADRFTEVYAPCSGYVQQVAVRPGAHIEAGAVLLELRDEELDLEIAQAESQVQELSALREGALAGSPAALDPLEKRREAMTKHLEYLRRQRALATLHSPQQGVWAAPRQADWIGTWAERGSPMGEIVDSSSFSFSAVVSQEEAAQLFAEPIRGLQVRLPGQAGAVLTATIRDIIPAQQDELPSAALGWKGGGQLEVQAQDETGRHTVQPFFRVVATITPTSEARLLHRRSGQIRFELPPQPLLKQGWRYLQQLVQKRYHI